MNYKKITAIINPAKLEAVEEKLKKLCVPGISVSKVKGYGEAPNFFHSDWTSEQSRIEVFVSAERAQEITEGIMDAAHTGQEGDGMVAVLPVEFLYQISSRELVEDKA